MKRYALIATTNTTVEAIGAHLPRNYSVIATVPHANAIDDSDQSPHCGPCAVVGGEDQAGWTLHGYVLPRLASGLIFGQEIDLSHPVMKTIPEERSGQRQPVRCQQPPAAPLVSPEQAREILAALAKARGHTDWMRRVLASDQLEGSEIAVDLAPQPGPDRDLLLRASAEQQLRLREPSEELLLAFTSLANDRLRLRAGDARAGREGETTG